MVTCKKCHSAYVVKNGFVRSEQRYRCKICALNFIQGDGRTSPQIAAKKALVVLLYARGKASFNMLGKLLGHSPSLIYRWVREAMDTTEEPTISGSIREMEFDEMWHFIGSKKTKTGSSKLWIVAQGELLPGLQAIRDAATFQRLYDKVKHLKQCRFYTLLNLIPIAGRRAVRPTFVYVDT
jgi:transposase